MRMKMGLTVCICAGSHSWPKRWRSIFSDWVIQEEEVWFQSDQNTAANGTRIRRFNSALTFSGLNCATNVLRPVGGRWTYLRRPTQKMTVAMAMATPGAPKAFLGPYFASIQGMSRVAMAEPKLMAK